MKHLEDHGLTYFQHLHVALLFASLSIAAGMIAIIHGLIPFIFETTAGDIHKSIMDKYQRQVEKYKG